MRKSAVPNYLPHFSEALMKAGATRSAIRSFSAYWNALPSQGSKLPCPLCYAQGHQGWLVGVIERARVKAVQCDRCRQIIDVSRAVVTH
jgi:hypothetical protein